MKVNIYETVEVSDDDRKKIAALLGQKTASREELKAFIWEHGSRWLAVARGENQATPDPEFREYVLPVADDTAEDLLGSNLIGIAKESTPGVAVDGSDLI